MNTKLNIKKTILGFNMLMVCGFAHADDYLAGVNYSYSYLNWSPPLSEIIINNTSDQDLVIHSIAFDVPILPNNDDANFGVQQSGLAGYATVTEQSSNGGYTLTVNESNKDGVTIPAHGSNTVQYQIPAATYNSSNDLDESTIAPFPLMPSNVSLVANAVTTPALIAPQGLCQGTACNDPSPNYQVGGYYADWDSWNFTSRPTDPASEINLNRVNTVYYAFIKFDQYGNVATMDNYYDPIDMPIISLMRATHPFLNFNLSFGGWQWDNNNQNVSPPWSQMAANPTSLKNFINNAVLAMLELGANGINIDWEYPVMRTSTLPPAYPTDEASLNQDAVDFVNLIVELRSKLDSTSALTGKKYNLSIAGPGGKDKVDAIESHYANYSGTKVGNQGAWETIAGALDYNSVMTYDYHGQWDFPGGVSDFVAPMQVDPKDPNSTTNSNNPYYGIMPTVNEYLQYGFQPKQLVLGMPLYGYDEGINSNTGSQGLYASPTATQPTGEPLNSNNGMYNYNCIVSALYNNNTQYCNHGDQGLLNMTKINSSAQIPSEEAWAYKNGYFISFDDVNAMITKANYIKTNGLGGMMFWEFNGDIPQTDAQYDTYSLISTAWKALNN